MVDMRTPRGWLLLFLIPLAAGCPSSPPPRPVEGRDFSTLHSLMGINQKLVFSLQSYIGDPPERDAIRANLEKLAIHFETIQALSSRRQREETEASRMVGPDRPADARASRENGRPGRGRTSSSG
jgi:hypothetical protein